MRTSRDAINALFEFSLDERFGSPEERKVVLQDLRSMWDRNLVTHPGAMIEFRRYATGLKWPGIRGGGAGASL